MPRKYSRSASKDVEREMRQFKKGKLKRGKGGKGGTVKSRKQAIAIGLSEARKKGKKIPKRATKAKKTKKKKARTSAERHHAAGYTRWMAHFSPGRGAAS